jgi:hypothetical protein
MRFLSIALNLSSFWKPAPTQASIKQRATARIELGGDLSIPPARFHSPPIIRAACRRPRRWVRRALADILLADRVTNCSFAGSSSIIERIPGPGVPRANELWYLIGPGMIATRKAISVGVSSLGSGPK